MLLCIPPPARGLHVFQISSKTDESTTAKTDSAPLSTITLYYGTKDTLVNIGVIPRTDAPLEQEALDCDIVPSRHHNKTKETNDEESSDDDDSLQTEDSALNSLVLVSRGTSRKTLNQSLWSLCLMQEWTTLRREMMMVRSFLVVPSKSKSWVPRIE